MRSFLNQLSISWTLRTLMRRTAHWSHRLSEQLSDAADYGEFKSRYPQHLEWVRDIQVFGQGDDQRWKTRNAEKGRLSVIAVTYKQPKALLAFLHSLECQTVQNFDVHVLHDGEDAESASAISKFQESSSLEIFSTFTSRRFNDWGHSLRSLALKDASGQYLLLTNGDNYYAPRFIEFSFMAIDDNNLDLLHIDMVHSHDRPGGRNSRSYQFFATAPFPLSIDMGALIVRTDIAKRVGFRHRDHAADARFLEDLLQSGEIRRIGHLKKALLTHN